MGANNSFHDFKLNCKYIYMIYVCQSDMHVMICYNVSIIKSTYHMNMCKIHTKNMRSMVKVAWTFKNGVKGTVLISSTS